MAPQQNAPAYDRDFILRVELSCDSCMRNSDESELLCLSVMVVVSFRGEEAQQFPQGGHVHDSGRMLDVVGVCLPRNYSSRSKGQLLLSLLQQAALVTWLRHES